MREHAKCDQEGVEIGGHAATSLLDVHVSNADFDSPLNAARPAPTPRRNGISHLEEVGGSHRKLGRAVHEQVRGAATAQQNAA
jgi:hypothetical protein